jgi:hypothetical protein
MPEQSDSPRDSAGAAQPSGGAPKDLSFLWPVIDRVRAVEIKFTAEDAASGAQARATPAIEARIRALEEEVAALKKSLRAGGAVDATADEPVAVPELLPQRWSRVAIAAVSMVLALLAAHWMIVFVYDWPTLVLRLVSIAIPLPLAIWLTLRYRISPAMEILFGLVVGTIAVFGMAYITSIHEKTAFLPENMREWQETLEYIASIMFAHLTGVLVSSAMQARSGAQNRAGEATLRLAQVIAFVTGRAVANGPAIKKHVDTVQNVISNLMPVASAIMAIVTGIKGILG